ncbi:MAG: FAD-dependent oxidoreductase, partial [Deltaproteobacteria bacterium]|nr:FAD-dependent oxidoreductase [Deltaproteobacteria bacterium]
MEAEQEGFVIQGVVDGERVDSRRLEEDIQRAVQSGCRNLLVQAFGHHGIGGRLWAAGDSPVFVRVQGPLGQRVGAMGFPNTRIVVEGPASDDVGWLNAGAAITVLGDVSNGCANAMAQGRVYVAGNAGARAMTMTKQNPRFDPPELWVLGSVGDYFAEFMAGGIAVVCGHKPQDPENILGYRPCVGMVGGKIFFRGPVRGFSQADAMEVPVSDADWDWLSSGLKTYLEEIGRPELYGQLAVRGQWRLIRARTPAEKKDAPRRPMASFYERVWEAELGAGGLLGDLLAAERGSIDVVATGKWRRFVPVWENKKYLPPCQEACPAGIPVAERWRLVREGRVDEAVDLALAYTPFPAAVCGYLCPNLCMQACSRAAGGMAPVDVTVLGRASMDAAIPKPPPVTGKSVAVIGGGPAGISTAWQLRLAGHRAVVYDLEQTLGGKMSSVIPASRIPPEVLDAELRRASRILEHVYLQEELGPEDIKRLSTDYDFVVIASGAGKPRTLPVPGADRAQTALDVLRAARQGAAKIGRRVVIIGAGNVGCDVATEAARLGAEDITLVDIQKPASFGKEREHAEAAGARFVWPKFAEAITEEGVRFKDGETLPADTVVLALGDAPDLSFLPESVETERGFVKVDDDYATTDPRVFAVGDVVRPGLLADAIGAGRKAAAAISRRAAGQQAVDQALPSFDPDRVKL